MVQQFVQHIQQRKIKQAFLFFAHASIMGKYVEQYGLQQIFHLIGQVLLFDCMGNVPGLREGGTAADQLAPEMLKIFRLILLPEVTAPNRLLVTLLLRCPHDSFLND